MLEVNLVNLVQAGGLSLVLFSFYLLKDYSHYAIIKVLLVFSGMSTITNFCEEVLGSRDWYLVSPVYLVGIGPMFYLCVVSLTRYKVHLRHFLHLFPMLLALPYTHHTQLVIVVGSVSFIIYAMIIRYVISSYEQRIQRENSNSEELSMQWFLHLVVVVAGIYTLDFVRLNLQPQIGPFWNGIGQLLANIAVFLTLAFLVKKLLQFSEDILQFQSQGFTFEYSEPQYTQQSATEKPEEPGQYQIVFQHLETQLVEEQLFRQPRLSLAQVAQTTGLQTRDISRAINLCSEQNFNDYINLHRVEAIKAELLASPDTPLLDIGLRNGFNSKTSFNNVFKRLVGMTPGRYRAKASE